MRVVWGLCILLWAAVVCAEDLYVAQTAAGADDGTSCANAKSAAWYNTAGNWGTGANKISAGDTVRLCGTLTSTLTAQGSGTWNLPVRVRYESGAKSSVAVWGTTTNAALVASSKSWLVFDGGTNGIIENTANGTLLANQLDSDGVYLLSCAYCVVRNLTIRNIYVRNPGSTTDSNRFGSGVLTSGGGPNHIRNNTITETENGIHVSYTAGTRDYEIFGNTITRVATGILMGASGTNVDITRVYAYRNGISNLAPWTTGEWAPGEHHHGDGIHIHSTSTGSSIGRVRVFANEVSGDFGDFTTAGIFIEQTNGTVNEPRVFNNLINITGTANPVDGGIEIRGANNPEIWHNTVLGVSSATSGGIHLGTAGTGADIQNNIIVGFARGIRSTAAGVTINKSERNVFNTINASQPFTYEGSLKTQAQWVALGFETESACSTDCLVVNGQLSTGSFCANSGTSLTEVPQDRDGEIRNRHDIGADERP